MAAEDGNKPKKLPPPTWAREKQVCPQEASGWASIDCWPERLKLPCHRSGFSLSRILHKVLDSYTVYNAGFLNVLLTLSHFGSGSTEAKVGLGEVQGPQGFERDVRGEQVGCNALPLYSLRKEVFYTPSRQYNLKNKYIAFLWQRLSSLYLNFLLNSLGFLRASAILKITYRILPLWSSG